jgi:lipoprotein-anchoring transpeptidase ErfK/SrfK
MNRAYMSIPYGVGNEFLAEKKANNEEVVPAELSDELLDATSIEMSGGELAIEPSPRSFFAQLPYRKLLALSLSALLLATLLINFSSALESNIRRAYNNTADELSAVILGQQTIHELSTNGLSVPSSDLTKLLGSIRSQHLTLSLGNHVITVSSAQISAWVEQTKLSSKTTEVAVSTNAIASYLTHLASLYTVQPINEVKVTHTDGTSAILVHGTNGTQFANSSTAIHNISRGLLNAAGMNISVPLVPKAYQVSSAPPFNKLLEVDLVTKRMYAYQQGTLIRTFLVTAGAPATPTPIGQFQIFEKLPMQNMSGYNTNGTMYYQPDVQWVNYFDGSDAIHGNYWRPLSYFGNINSSHGCVGVVNSDAEWIYDWAPIGTTVIVHD